MEGIDESTELWRHPSKLLCLYGKTTKFAADAWSHSKMA